MWNDLSTTPFALDIPRIVNLLIDANIFLAFHNQDKHNCIFYGNKWNLHHILKNAFEIGDFGYNFQLCFYTGTWRSRVFFYDCFGSYSCSANFSIDYQYMRLNMCLETTCVFNKTLVSVMYLFQRESFC